MLFRSCYSVALIHIGREATVSQYSYLCTASHDPDVPGLPLVAAPIRIGDRAWVGADVFVAPGVSIAEGAVVGARSTVLGNVGTGEIVGGAPARLFIVTGARFGGQLDLGIGFDPGPQFGQAVE